ncbi:hypothetical protein NP233_g11577 [Leucocoprinus birnbaumii]|uniref:Uncharacterized protein n=1 Tax=Leucocoprinus birnbaumii TaxID=56174 RepID=A0AAD5VH72_9AGAR|nr:hypothetical protein NP233_g11577 [Leucocoprinus birnbaumii]
MPHTRSQASSTSGNSAPINPPIPDIFSLTESEAQILMRWGDTPQGQAFLESHSGGQAEMLEAAYHDGAFRRTSISQPNPEDRPQTPPATQPVAGTSANINPPSQIKRHFYLDLTKDSPIPSTEPANASNTCDVPSVAAGCPTAKLTRNNTVEEPAQVEMKNCPDTRMVLTAANISLEITHFNLKTPTKTNKRKVPADDSDEDIENRPVDRKGKQRARQKRACHAADNSPTPWARRRSRSSGSARPASSSA